MNRLRLSILFVVLVLVSGASARELSLVNAIDLAVQHSYSVRAGRAQRAAFEQALRSARAERLPTLTASATGSYASEVMSLDIDLPSDLHISREFGSRETYLTGFKLAVPLYTGGKLSGGIDFANAALDYYTAVEQAGVEQTVFAARAEYLSLIRAEKLLEVSRASLERANIIRKDVEALYAAGAADSVDLLQARLAVTQAEFGVQQARTNRRSVEIRLTTLLGLDPSESLQTGEDLPTPPDDSPIATDVKPDKPQLQAAYAASAMSRSQVAMARSDFFPTLSAFGGYTYGKPNLDQFNNTWNDYFSFGAALTWSFNLANKSGSNLRKSQHLYQTSLYEQDRITEQLGREARLSAEQLRLAHARFETARQSHRTTSENYRLATIKHRQGDLSANRLLEIEAELAAAESSLAAALVDYYLAESAYYYATGSEKLKEGL
jgi:outer membrane protein